MCVYGAMNCGGLGHGVWRVSSWSFGQMGFVWVARVGIKGQRLPIKGTRILQRQRLQLLT